jgi:hypothetical protein
MRSLKLPRRRPTVGGMSDLPAAQPFVCEVCHIIFGSRKALDAHQQDPHPRWYLTEGDKDMLRNFRIKYDDTQ